MKKPIDSISIILQLIDLFKTALVAGAMVLIDFHRRRAQRATNQADLFQRELEIERLRTKMVVDYHDARDYIAERLRR